MWQTLQRTTFFSGCLHCTTANGANWLVLLSIIRTTLLPVCLPPPPPICFATDPSAENNSTRRAAGHGCRCHSSYPCSASRVVAPVICLHSQPDPSQPISLSRARAELHLLGNAQSHDLISDGAAQARTSPSSRPSLSLSPRFLLLLRVNARDDHGADEARVCRGPSRTQRTRRALTRQCCTSPPHRASAAPLRGTVPGTPRSCRATETWRRRGGLGRGRRPPGRTRRARPPGTPTSSCCRWRSRARAPVHASWSTSSPGLWRARESNTSLVFASCKP